MRHIGRQGQSTIEYILMVAFGAALSVQIASFFNETFVLGLQRLERNIQQETSTGQRFRP